MIHSTAVVDPGAYVGHETFVWHYCHIMAGAHVGARCVLGQNCFVGGKVRIGDGCRIQNNVSLYDGVVLDREVFVGPSAVFTNVPHPRAAFPKERSHFGKTYVAAGATIGANATILSNLSIGSNAMVGAGAVVTRSVPAYALVLGAPARIVGWVCACGETLFHELPREPTTFTCDHCARHYGWTANDGLRAETADEISS